MRHRAQTVKVELDTTSTIERNTSRRVDAEETPANGLFLSAYRAIFVSAATSKLAKARRLASPIRAYVGPNGGGKTLCMVTDALDALRAGRKVLSTVTLLNPDTGKPFPNFTLFTDWDQLLEARNTTVLMDEMVGIANSRSASSLDVRAQNKLMQLRRADVDLSWSAPNWARADKIVREVTQTVTECRGRFAAPMPKDADPLERRLWRPKRVFVWKTYDTQDFEEWTAGKRDTVKPVSNGVERHYGPGSEGFRAYDTLDAVSIVAGMTPEGTCDICNGSVRRHVCKGHDAAEQELARIERRASLGLAVDGSTV